MKERGKEKDDEWGMGERPREGEEGDKGDEGVDNIKK